jgi:hypothetical protein
MRLQIQNVPFLERFSGGQTTTRGMGTQGMLFVAHLLLEIITTWLDGRKIYGPSILFFFPTVVGYYCFPVPGGKRPPPCQDSQLLLSEAANKALENGYASLNGRVTTSINYYFFPKPASLR